MANLPPRDLAFWLRVTVANQGEKTLRSAGTLSEPAVWLCGSATDGVFCDLARLYDEYDARRENTSTPDWERILSAASVLQLLPPEAVLVGDTAAALHAHHRIYYDADQVVMNLKERFDAVLADLESAAGWQTVRVHCPVLILGSLVGIETGVRQLIRNRPLETEVMQYEGQSIVIPTIAEMLRIKAWLTLSRNATLDYIDVAALSIIMGIDSAITALLSMDDYYPQTMTPSSMASPVRQQM